MKMVKSLLLGSAAGLFAVAGAQAADLPVKAKAVEYVKVCSLYGAGYYYIPGTDTCIKLGGFVRYEARHNALGGTDVPHVGGSSQAAYNRHTDTFAHRARGTLTADVRTQTEYGTLRSYWAFGFQNASGGAIAGTGAQLPVPSAFSRAFIQFAGFTAGVTTSFYTFYNPAAYSTNAVFNAGSDAGPQGVLLVAYTAQFGNGVSASISLEDSQARSKAVVDLSAGAAGALSSANLFPGFGASTNDEAGIRNPNIVGNIRVDQAWGSAQIMGALHEVRARYYNGPFAGTTCTAVAGIANTTACQAPDDEWGWAVGAGLTLKMPWNPKDTLSFETTYSEGALTYIAANSATMTLHKSGGFALVPVTDAVFNNAGGARGQLELTEAWGITGAFEHWWTPSLRTSFQASYIDIDYNQTASNAICGAIANGGGLFVAAPAFAGTCNPDSQVYRLASRTLWNPVANLDIGLEVAYTKLESEIQGAANLAPGGGLPTSRYSLTDQEVWQVGFYVQRNFWP